MQNDTISKTVIVATLLCIVCSVLVSTAAVQLKPRQNINRERETKRNILLAAGLLREDISIEKAFEKIRMRIADLKTGEFVEGEKFQNFDQRAAAKDPALSVAIPEDLDIAKIKRRSRYATVYLVMNEANIDTIILPIYGKGLWSTMYAFIALEDDMSSVKGFSFYEHGETPGLGGEVDNPLWKGQWPGKEIYDTDYNLVIDVQKGKVNPSHSQAKHQIDGLSGATLTTIGVENLILYWLGKDGFEPLLAKLRAQGGTNG